MGTKPTLGLRLRDTRRSFLSVETDRQLDSSRLGALVAVVPFSTGPSERPDRDTPPELPARLSFFSCVLGVLCVLSPVLSTGVGSAALLLPLPVARLPFQPPIARTPAALPAALPAGIVPVALPAPAPPVVSTKALVCAVAAAASRRVAFPPRAPRTPPCAPILLDSRRSRSSRSKQRWIFDPTLSISWLTELHAFQTLFCISKIE
mmetsp:Transcript_75557/g.172943  ORF Transcript_75557/g.172943 Transcript_75557/m.172943 type:complete len:206 (-) Transcript_75557:2337-2954(-)